MFARLKRDQSDTTPIGALLERAGLSRQLDQILTSGVPDPFGVVYSSALNTNDSPGRLYGVLSQGSGPLKVVSPIWQFDVSWHPYAGVVSGHPNTYIAYRLHDPQWYPWLKSSRCLVVATGFYELDPTGSGRIFSRIEGEAPFFIGGVLRSLGNGREHAAAIVARYAKGQQVPSRCRYLPLFIPPECALDWLATGINSPTFNQL